MAALFLDFQFGCPVCLRLQKRVSLQVISCALLFCMSCVVLEFCDCEFTVSGSEYPGSVVYLCVGFLWCMIFDKDAEFLASDASKSSTWHFAVWPLPCPTPALQIKAVSCLVVGWPCPAATHLHSPMPALRDKGEKTAFPQCIYRKGVLWNRWDWGRCKNGKNYHSFILLKLEVRGLWYFLLCEGYGQ